MTTWHFILKVEAYSLGYVLFCIPLTCILSFSIPKELKSRYLRPPYYSTGEVVWLTSFPKCLTLGLHFSFMTIFPRLAKRRGLEDAHLDAPRWWKFTSYVYFLAAFVPMMLWLITAMLFYIQTRLNQ